VVVIAGGHCLAYLGRGGRSLALFPSDSPDLTAAQVFHALAECDAQTRMPRFRIEAAEALIADVPPPRDTVALTAMATARLGKKVLDLEDVTVRYPGPPTDSGEGAQEALQGSTYGLGQVIGTALRRTRPSDTLLVGLSRSAVHDGGAGALDALGGATAAMDLLAGRSLGLVLADDVALGGMNGAGASLAEVTSLSPEQAQELDRRACAVAMEAVNTADTIRHSSSGAQRMLPVVSALDDTRTSSVPGNLELEGAARMSASTWGTGAAGGSAMVLRSLGAWARPGARVMAEILDLSGSVRDQDLVVTASGELYDVLADSIVGVVGQHAASQALPCVLVCGRSATTRGELAGAGVTNAYSLQEPHAVEPWDCAGPDALETRLTDLGARLARTWSR